MGSEFVRHFLSNEWQVIGLDNNEWATASFPTHPNLTKKLRGFESITGSYDLIVHCAAYKHIDLIESNKEAAGYNNVELTKVLYSNVTGPVLFISTDKAVEPSSFYGQTKKEGEEITKVRGGVIARLGNIMGSSGSVIPKWEAAIAAGDPLPITDRRMTRYMTQGSEAVIKIMELYPLASPGDVIIPSLGEPISLLDLAEQTLQLHGLTLVGKNPYPIVDIGIRPAEKLHEKLSWDDEKVIISNLSGNIVRR